MATSEPRPLTPVKRRRQEAKLLQAQVAEQAGISSSYLSMIEAGLVPPGHVQERVARAVGRTVAKLWPEVAA